MMADAPPPVTREVILDETLPHPKSVARVEARRIRMEPDVAAGLHAHNGPVFGVILTGSVVYQIEGEPERQLGAGDVFYEPEGARIARFDAQGEGVEFVGYFPLGPGESAELTTLS